MNSRTGEGSFTERGARAADGGSLLDLLRARLGSGAPPRGCRDGRCGACLVELDGELVRACATAATAVAGASSLRTARDVACDPSACEARTHFTDARPTRCRLCVDALMITASHLARERIDDPTLALHARAIRCACTGSGSIERALHAALRPK